MQSALFTNRAQGLEVGGRQKFGQGSRGGGLTLEQFQELYRGDPFYNLKRHHIIKAGHRVVLTKGDYHRAQSGTNTLKILQVR